MKSEPPEPYLAASPEAIAAASCELGVTFPPALVAIWMVSNGLELRGGWRFLPTFDNREPRKTCNHIVYENTKARWSYMSNDLIVIARGDTGNCLVLRKVEQGLDAQVLLWNHETNLTKKWSKNLDYILRKAQERVTKVHAQIARSLRRRRKTG